MRPADLLSWCRDAFSVVFPSVCAVCGERLCTGERHVCTACYLALPFTHICGVRGNVVERLFWGRLPIERASSFLHYEAGCSVNRVFFRLKYFGRPQIGHFFGRIMAGELSDTDFFEGIDLIIPLPLHPKKQRRRGYNQSEALARGVAEVTGIPVLENAVVRVVDTPTQTRLTRHERMDNVADAFSLPNPEALVGKHVLLIDDVLTTGATLSACGQALASAASLRMSVLTLGLAGEHTLTAELYEDWRRQPLVGRH